MMLTDTYTTGTLADTVGAVNPFRYKSYYYDSETRLYYLQSRYYDPQVGRFLNADSTDYLGATGTVLSFNLFAYCENNSVNNEDPSGKMIDALSLPIIYNLSAYLSILFGGISVSLASIKTAILSVAIPVLAIAAIGVAVGGIIYAIRKAQSIINDTKRIISYVKKLVKSSNGNGKGNYRGHCVYVIATRKENEVIYVGRTNSYSRRKYEHFDSPSKKRFSHTTHKMVLVKDNLTKNESRVLEQAVICAYTIDALKNAINSISPRKWSDFKKEIGIIAQLIECSFDG